MKPVRSPELPPDWLAPLLVLECIKIDWCENIPHELRCFREAYAGCARLSHHVHACDILVARPLEAYPSHDNAGRGGRYLSFNDLANPDVIDMLVKEIGWGYYLWIHFDISCTAWARMNILNGGTRRKDAPDGESESLERKKRANKAAEIVAMLCDLLHRRGCLLSIEQPRLSFIWSCSWFLVITGRMCRYPLCMQF